VKADKPEVEDEEDDEEDDDEDDDKDEDEAEGRLSVLEILLTLFHCFIYPDSFFLINFYGEFYLHLLDLHNKHIFYALTVITGNDEI